MVDGKLKASSLGSIPYNGDLYWISYDIGIIASDSWQKQGDYLVQEDLDGAMYNGIDITAKGRHIFKNIMAEVLPIFQELVSFIDQGPEDMLSLIKILKKRAEWLETLTLPLYTAASEYFGEPDFPCLVDMSYFWETGHLP